MNLPTLEAMHAFLARHYKYDRFEGRNDPSWCPNYSSIVAQSTIDQLAQCGLACVSQFESRSGDAVWFGPDLEILTDHAEIRARLLEPSSR